jgi:hypothetical protein
MAGTDCGLGPRVGHAKIAWAKLEALAEGARIATKRLWAKPQKGKSKGESRKAKGES